MAGGKGHAARIRPGQVSATLTLMRLGRKNRRGEARSETLHAVLDEADAGRLRELLAGELDEEQAAERSGEEGAERAGERES